MQRDRPKARASREPVFVPPPTEDNLGDVLHESLTQRPAEAGDAATPKQLSYIRALIRDNGMADADVELMVNQHAAPWPGDVATLSKPQAGKLIELLK